MSLDSMENNKKGAMMRLFTYFIVSLKLLPVCKKCFFKLLNHSIYIYSGVKYECLIHGLLNLMSWALIFKK